MAGTGDEPTGRRTRLLTALMAGISFVLSLLLAEGAIRLSYPLLTPKHHFQPGLYVEDPENAYGLLPGYRGHWMEYTSRAATTINARGYRGPEETPERLAADLRVAVVGDSVAFGRGVADGKAYPHRLEALLRERGVDAAVFNLAVPGYNTWFERRTLERHIERIDPQVVVLGWYRNDVGPVPSDMQVIDGYLIRDEDAYREWRDRIDHRSWRQSALLRWISLRWKLWRKSLSLDRRAAREDTGAPEGLAGSIAELNRIQEISRERGAAFVLVVHPAHEEVLSPHLGAETYETLRGGVEAGDLEGFTTVLELAPQWRELPDENFYLSGDRCHPNDHGHDFIAHALAELPVLAGTRRARSR